MKITIIRLIQSGIQTLGMGFVFDGTEKKFEFSTLELPWKDNQKNISCIPSGTYDAFKRQSPSRGVVFELKGTGHRTHIQIHAGNYYTDILGCVLVGAGFSDINNDGFRDVYSSKTTLNKLLDLMPETFMITIVRSEEHTSELQSPMYLVCRLLLEKKKTKKKKQKKTKKNKKKK